MRLIDADALLQEIEESANAVEIQIHLGKCDENVAKGMLSGLALVRENILRKPTAYDTEKVVAELKKQKSDLTDWAEDKAFEIGIERAIEVVRKGGVE